MLPAWNRVFNSALKTVLVALFKSMRMPPRTRRMSRKAMNYFHIAIATVNLYVTESMRDVIGRGVS